MHILLVTNFEFQQQNASGKYIIDKTTQVKFTLENQTESFTLPKDNMDSTSKFMLMYNKTGLDTDGKTGKFKCLCLSLMDTSSEINYLF